MVIQPTQQARLMAREAPLKQVAIMKQKWRDLLFLHWECDPSVIQQTLPKGLHVDTFNGKAYIGMTPFFMKDIELSFMPLLPGISNALELNIRTYVHDEKGIPGVWFYSLDINSRMAVQGARSFYYLPYFYADMRAQKNAKGDIDYECRREGNTKSPYARFVYRPEGGAQQAQPETLEFFLAERYILFSHDGKGLYKGRIHHQPYPLSSAHVSIWDEMPLQWDGLDKFNRGPDHVMFSSGVDVSVYPLTQD